MVSARGFESSELHDYINQSAIKYPKVNIQRNIYYQCSSRNTTIQCPPVCVHYLDSALVFSFAFVLCLSFLCLCLSFGLNVFVYSVVLLLVYYRLFSFILLLCHHCTGPLQSVVYDFVGASYIHSSLEF